MHALKHRSFAFPSTVLLFHQESQLRQSSCGFNDKLAAKLVVIARAGSLMQKLKGDAPVASPSFAWGLFMSLYDAR